MDYIETEINSLQLHKFEHYVMRASEFATLPMTARDKQGRFLYMVEVYVDDFMSPITPVSKEQMQGSMMYSLRMTTMAMIQFWRKS